MKFKFVILTSLSGLLFLSLGCKTITPSAMTTTSTAKKTETTRDAPRPMPSPLDASLLIARQYEQSGNFPDAIGVLEAIVAEQGDIPTALHRLGVMYSKTGQSDLAKQYFEKAVKVDPNNSELLTDFGFLSFVTNDVTSAEKSYLAALKANPTLKRAHNNLGVLLAKTGRLDLAQQHFRWAGNDEEAVQQNIRLATVETTPQVQQSNTQPMQVYSPNVQPPQLQQPDAQWTQVHQSNFQPPQVQLSNGQWPQVHQSNPRPPQVQQSNVQLPQVQQPTGPVQIKLSKNPPRVDILETPYVYARKLEKKSELNQVPITEATEVVQTAYWDDAEEESCQLFLDETQADDE